MSELIQSSKVTALTKINDFVVKFANVNGSGSASANGLFAKAVFRMGIPISPHNIFPSNIQGLPTWFEVRINKNGYLGRREGVDLIVAMNEQTIGKDIASVVPGGYVLYDSSKTLSNELLRDDVTYLPIPLKDICLEEFEKTHSAATIQEHCLRRGSLRISQYRFQSANRTCQRSISRQGKAYTPKYSCIGNWSSIR